MSKSGVATIIAGLGLLIPASLGLLVSNVPTILCPFPALTPESVVKTYGELTLRLILQGFLMDFAG